MGWLRGVLNWLEADAEALADAAQHSLMLQQKGDLAQAEALHQQWSLQDSEGLIALLYGAVTALLRQQWQEALSALELVIHRGGEQAEVFTMLGTVSLQLGDPQRALQAHQRALQLKPHLAEAHRGCADALRSLGHLDQAITAYEHALRWNPEYVQAHWNLATTLLLTGAYQRGWQHYSVRFSPLVGVSPLVVPSIPMADGVILEKGGRLLLIAEQGLGDTLQFVRYALLLQDMGVEVSVLAQPQLHGVLAASGVPLVPPGFDVSDLDAVGAWLPLISLPALLGVSPQDPKVTLPYLQRPSSLADDLQIAFAATRRPRVALHWQGNPSVEISNFQGRSLPLEAFAPLASVEDVEFLSVQKGYGSEQLDACSFRHRFASCQPLVDQLWDFRDIAAVISRCDLLITSDTAVAHLAGAMGHPVWCLLKRIPDWRWGLEGETSFWYPSMRLFRQQQAGDWKEVMGRVALALSQFVASR